MIQNINDIKYQLKGDMKLRRFVNCLMLCVLTAVLMLGCSSSEVGDTAATEDMNEGGVLTLPMLEPVDLGGGKLRVVATTSLIGDVVAQVGGAAIELTTLMEPGQDPHSYEPGARELTAVADAHVIFVNGWDLEESLIGDLENIGGTVAVVPVSANITPLTFGDADAEHEDEEGDHDHGRFDPHVWFSVANVKQWTANIEQTLSALDPGNADVYGGNTAVYQTQLTELETYVTENLATIPAENRYLVTNHGAFNYFARAYDFEIVGTVITGFSTLAEPSASDMADLIAVMQAHQVCAIFTETTVNDQLAKIVADELDFCDSVQILPLYTGSLGAVGSGADSYLGWMETNVDTIVAGLR
jgi:ABC-type Zn uptake system ZnuABC Zn-binding protein ZnuA